MELDEEGAGAIEERDWLCEDTPDEVMMDEVAGGTVPAVEESEKSFAVEFVSREEMSD